MTDLWSDPELARLRQYAEDAEREATASRERANEARDKLGWAILKARGVEKGTIVVSKGFRANRYAVAHFDMIGVPEAGGRPFMPLYGHKLKKDGSPSESQPNYIGTDWELSQ